MEFAAAHPWRVAAGAFALFCLGALYVYRAYPLSMDEYAALFQAQVFAAGRLAGRFPPDLLDALLPRFPPGYFLTASRATGEVSSTYWPGFALVLAPFAWLDIPWAVNPAISALALPVVHRLAASVSGSREAAGWAVLLTLASPVFIVSAMSYYSMPAHLLCSALYALLLLKPTAPRALLAGLIGSIALVLHNPVPHLLFAAAFVIWLLFRRSPVAVFAALLAGYLPLVALLGFGWQQHLDMLAAAPGAAAAAAADAAPAAAVSLFDRMWTQLATLVTLPRPAIIEARIAGLSKVWTWAGGRPDGARGARLSGGARAGAGQDPRRRASRDVFRLLPRPGRPGPWLGLPLPARGLFVLPVLAGLALSQMRDSAELRNRARRACAEPDARQRRTPEYGGMGPLRCPWCFANGLRLVQVDAFMTPAPEPGAATGPSRRHRDAGKSCSSIPRRVSTRATWCITILSSGRRALRWSLRRPGKKAPP